MSANFKFDLNKSIILVQYVLANLENQVCGFHKLFKILYFAEKKHLAIYGRPITGDRYIAMQAGPVPSLIYGTLQFLRGDNSPFTPTRDLSNYFDIVGSHHVKLKEPSYNIEMLSESEIECLDESITENKNLPFITLKNKSHDTAWDAADENDSISMFEIAKSGGANEDMLTYISVNCENHTKLVFK